MRGEQRARRVQHAHAAGRQLAERPEPVVHPVERRQDVEPAERGVAWPERIECLGGREAAPLDPAATGRGETGIRLVSALGDDGDAHAS